MTDRKKRISIKERAYATVFALVGLSAPMSTARQVAPLELPPATQGIGAQVLLHNSGIGLGSYYMKILNEQVTLLAEMSVSGINDGREVAFFTRLGRKEVPDKANYVLQIPVQVGIERRLFRETIEDNFRPFFHAVTGPTLIWKSPYFEDLNSNQELDSNERVFGWFQSLSHGSPVPAWSGTISIGAHFGGLTGSTQSLRFGYTFTYFFDEISLLVPSIREPAKWLGSPTIRLSFGRLY